MYDAFSLVLMVTHACNLRCSYCYTGTKFRRSMPEATGLMAIDRALASIRDGGRLHLGFFGGEPLLEASLVQRLGDDARRKCDARGVELALDITTNGTMLESEEAWSLLSAPNMSVAVSCDGLPAIHDRHRVTPGRDGSSANTVATIRRLVRAGKHFRVVMVVRPDTVTSFAEGLEYLQSLGVISVVPSLDLWCTWDADAIGSLERSISEGGRVWREAWPSFHVGWFDTKLAQAVRARVDSEIPRCGFGRGEMAVAPSGRLYPCERLIEEDQPSNPMILGHVEEGTDFLATPDASSDRVDSCQPCALQSWCDAVCRCSNYVRTGSALQPDQLLCVLEQQSMQVAAEAYDSARLALRR